MKFKIYQEMIVFIPGSEQRHATILDCIERETGNVYQVQFSGSTETMIVNESHLYERDGPSFIDTLKSLVLTQYLNASFPELPSREFTQQQLVVLNEITSGIDPSNNNK
jgi:hypothetical protein